MSKKEKTKEELENYLLNDSEVLSPVPSYPEVELTEAQKTSRRIQEMEPHPDFIPSPNIPIPVGFGIIVKPWKPAGGIMKLDSGLLGSVQNVENQGIIMAVGPKCSDWVRSGLMCKFYPPQMDHHTQAPQGLFLHTDGQQYVGMDEGSIQFLIPSANTVSYGSPKDSNDRRRDKRKDQLKSITKQDAKDDANEKDRRNDKTAGKTQILFSTNKGEA